ncbi:lysostaphin resistance A-like protein [Paenibacillus tarimensis]
MHLFKIWAMWLFVIVVGFILFVIPQIPFQMGAFGGYKGKGLAIIGIVQFILVVPFLYWGLRRIKLNLRDLGLITSNRWKQDVLLGIGASTAWAIVQFMWLIPATGGADRPDIAGIMTMLDQHWVNVLWYLPLGVIGGGFAEELYNRGFVIGVLRKKFPNSKPVLTIGILFAIVFFAAGHLPANGVEWMDLLIPSTTYTLLYLWTQRLTASMVAHGLWNTIAVTFIYILYI